MALYGAERSRADISAIIVNYNGADLLPRCLSALREAAGSPEMEIVVVDNGSSDGSLAVLDGPLGPDRVVALEGNAGFGRANNGGMEAAGGRYYLLLNTDCFVRPGLPAALLACLESDPRAAAAGPRLLNPDGTLQPSCHNFPTPPVLLLEQSGLWKALGRIPFIRDRLQVAGKHERQDYVDWLVGACLLMRAGPVTEAGGFDPRYFFYWEEADLSLRLKEAGWNTLFCPAAEAVHLGGGSSTDPRLLRQFFKSLYLFYEQHYPGYMLLMARATVRLMALFKWARAGTTRLFAHGSERGRAAASEAAAWLAVARL